MQDGAIHVRQGKLLRQCRRGDLLQKSEGRNLWRQTWPTRRQAAAIFQYVNGFYHYFGKSMIFRIPMGLIA
ncbi:hypothetical protein A0U89_16010 (plasmid) [Kozakia baliensis]|uniref:Uncharacterized protein n=1 Tax=Kozakia baliensis TaxID=153496 RepID=A0A1D8UYT9_9PROT|nr:hypothetical protein A0U89_16010 [Kozakia baliensis]